jgi:hypothetical protein
MNLTKSYVITKGPDGTHWISIEPLRADLKRMLDDPELAVSRNQIEVVLVFIESMLAEARIQEYQKIERNDEATYAESLH